MKTEVSKLPRYMRKRTYGKDCEVVLVTKRVNGEDMRIFLDEEDIIKIAREFKFYLKPKQR
tara:strand:- start:320 stop:502 length:183 start_codon:yes stop_codon:yes gene_type:complete